ncbi:hypothetical protein AVEN_183335-1 [Araneus ventricosus]|uniref:Uncharacterized protein n=1 Tax=Araneus ventricosus TaxID=182803 RepID=A0A4Y2W6M9_ARAVE|nr:hypothetical protein AVEN_183335-1 [Araneus ventricosus]
MARDRYRKRSRSRSRSSSGSLDRNRTRRSRSRERRRRSKDRRSRTPERFRRSRSRDRRSTVEEKTDIQELVVLCNEADNNNYRIAGPSKNIPSPFKRALLWLQRQDDKRKKKDLFNIKYQDLISIMP